jgi:DNA-binding transcriptional ArsR family regulator
VTSDPRRQSGLWEELDVNTMWVHVLRGTPLDDMGINAIAVYVMLKTYTNLESGVAFPSITTLATRLQTSEDTVGRAMNRLLELGLIEKTRVGRKNHYYFVERLPITTKIDQLEVGQAAVRYLPLQLREMMSELQGFARNGAPPGAGINITLNITAVTGEHATVNIQNVSMGATPAEQKPSMNEILEGVRERLLKNNADLKGPPRKS